MLNIPENIRQLIKRNNITEETQRHLRLSFHDDSIGSLYPSETLFPDVELYPSSLGEPWLVIEDEKILSESLVLEETLCSDDYLRFGACEAAKFELTVADILEDIKNAWFVAELIIGDYKLAFGIYKVDSVEVQKDKRFKKIIAYDRMRELDTDVSVWYKNLKFPLTLKEFRNSLIGYFGFPQEAANLPNDTMTVNQTNTDAVINARKILEAICELNGVFGTFDRTGTFKYVSLGYGGLYPSEDLFPEDNGLYPGESSDPEDIPTTYKTIDYKEWVVESIDKVKLINKEGETAASFGTGNNEYVIKDNFLIFGKKSADLLPVAENLYSNLSGRTYLPSSIELQALPYIEVGDLLNINYSKGVVETFVMKRTSKGIQAMMDTIGSEGDQYQTQSGGTLDDISNIKSNISRNENDINQNKTDISRVDGYSQQVGQNLSGEVTRAKTAEGKNAQAIFTETERATKTEGALSSRITDTASKFERELSDTTTGLSTKITQTASEIRLEAKDTKTELSSLISQTASEIRSEVSDVSNGLASKITQTASSIRSEISSSNNATKQTLRSEIQQTASSITSTVNSEISGVKSSMSQIKQTADKISWVVESGSSSSNFTLTSRMANLVAREINLTGYVRFNDLKNTGSTEINGSNIKTGRIDCNLITSGGYTVFSGDGGTLYFGNSMSRVYMRASKFRILDSPNSFSRLPESSTINIISVCAAVNKIISLLQYYGLAK